MRLTQLTNAVHPLQEKNVGVSTAGELPLETDPEHPDFLRPRGLYLHVPFCFHKCHYCDFYSIVETRGREAAFIQRVIDELHAAAAFLRAPIEAIFVGGGTPTLLSPELWKRLTSSIHESIPLAAEVEFTSEANPETVTAELVDVLCRGCLNRISVGAQSFNSRLLEVLERWHEPRSVERSLRIVRGAGIVNINLDLIFAIPTQTLMEWRDDLRRAIDLEPTHISCYGLMYEPNTPLTARLRSGLVARVNDDLEAEMYELTIEVLKQAGYEHYEISNWAKVGYKCRHNLLYWKNEQWWPLGPSASGHAGGWRWKNIGRLGSYLESGPLPPIVDAERLDEDGRIGEEFMLGLRLINGMRWSRVEQLLARGERGPARAATIAQHEAAGLLERADAHLRLTRRGLLLADAVLSDLL